MSKWLRQQLSSYAKTLVCLLATLLILVPPIWAIFLHQTQGQWPAWSGIGDYTSPSDLFHPSKTLWDVWGLLVVPVVLVIGAYLLNRAERGSERELADDRLQENALQAYLDRMTELVLEKGLHTPEGTRNNTTGDGQYQLARDVARARTITVLRSLNGMRKSMVIRFLWEAKLITGNEPIIGLHRADLSGMQLAGHNLQFVNLAMTVLKDADLRGTQIDGANFYKANLNGADLFMANVVPVATVDPKQDSFSLRSYMREGFLYGEHQVNFGSANLTQASFHNSALYGAHFENANLSRANLRNADLRGADFTGAKVTDKQLMQSRSLYAATMTDGQRYDGRFNLSDDVESARAQGVDPSNHKEMIDWYKGEG